MEYTMCYSFCAKNTKFHLIFVKFLDSGSYYYSFKYSSSFNPYNGNYCFLKFTYKKTNI